MTAPADISVVIPTFNRAPMLPRVIEALMSQECDGFTYEVIYVSNGSTDSTSAVLREASERYDGRLRFFEIAPTGGPAAPRNHAIRHATGDVVIIEDDDIVPAPDMVRTHLEFHRAHPEPHHAALGDVYVPDELMSHPMSVLHEFPYHEFRGRDRLSWLHFWTCNVSVKRRFMLEHGMFDERFLGYEDVLCGRRLADAGMHLHFLPASRAEHLHRFEGTLVPAKARQYGMWLHSLLEVVPDPEAMERFGVLSRRLGWWRFVRRLIRRTAFRLTWRPRAAFFRLLGATNGRRSRWSDKYYLMMFRRHLVAGYHEARRKARAGTPHHEPVPAESNATPT